MPRTRIKRCIDHRAHSDNGGKYGHQQAARNVCRGCRKCKRGNPGQFKPQIRRRRRSRTATKAPSLLTFNGRASQAATHLQARGQRTGGASATSGAGTAKAPSQGQKRNRPLDAFKKHGLEPPGLVVRNNANFKEALPSSNSRQRAAASAMRPLVLAAVAPFLPPGASDDAKAAYVQNVVQTTRHHQGKANLATPALKAKIAQYNKEPRGDEKRRQLTDLVADNTMAFLRRQGLAVGNTPFAQATRRGAVDGIGVPKPHVSRGRRVDVVKVKRLLSALYGRGNVDRLAFGERIVALMSAPEIRQALGGDITLDRVMRSKYGATILRDYLAALVDPYDDAGEQCFHHDKRSLLRCRLPKGHTKKGPGGQPVPSDHAYTPDEAVSFSTAMEIIKMLTPDQLASLAGLDDVAQEKGHENFRFLKQLVRRVLDSDAADTAKETIDVADGYIRRKWKDDLVDSSTNGDCCLKRCFCPEGNIDPEWQCDHEHTTGCPELHAMRQLFTLLETKASARASAGEYAGKAVVFGDGGEEEERYGDFGSRLCVHA